MQKYFDDYLYGENFVAVEKWRKFAQVTKKFSGRFQWGCNNFGQIMNVPPPDKVFPDKLHVITRYQFEAYSIKKILNWTLFSILLHQFINFSSFIRILIIPFQFFFQFDNLISSTNNTVIAITIFNNNLYYDPAHIILESKYSLALR